MVAEQEGWRLLPRALKVEGDEETLEYALVEGRFALHKGKASTIGTSLEVDFNETGVRVMEGEPIGHPVSGDHLSPVYRLGSNGPRAVPTGLIFVRMTNGRPLATAREDLEAAGYRIREVLSYAPDAGFVVSSSGELPEALAGTDRLRAVAGVARVEPQMLIERIASPVQEQNPS